jgi:hypothetical protein
MMLCASLAWEGSGDCQAAHVLLSLTSHHERIAAAAAKDAARSVRTTLKEIVYEMRIAIASNLVTTAWLAGELRPPK